MSLAGNPMTHDYDYDQAFQALLEQIQAYAPRACRLLETMKEQRSAYAAYHAAFVIICLQARRKSLRKIFWTDSKPASRAICGD